MERNYNDKRNFNRTNEPKDTGSRKRSEKPIFVVQKHDASNLHYDFRVEVDGVLKSWSVPKGPNTSSLVKRMAIPTEDHPMSYADFEGVIIQGEYGGGTVMIWDKGTVESIRTSEDGTPVSLEESYEAGSMEIELHGKKLRGGYNLIRMKGGKMRGNWLLVKREDKYADARKDLLETQPDSAVSGRSLAQISKEERPKK